MIALKVKVKVKVLRAWSHRTAVRATTAQPVYSPQASHRDAEMNAFVLLWNSYEIRLNYGHLWGIKKQPKLWYLNEKLFSNIIFLSTAMWCLSMLQKKKQKQKKLEYRIASAKSVVVLLKRANSTGQLCRSVLICFRCVTRSQTKTAFFFLSNELIISG